jgi:hypothetical protein
MCALHEGHHEPFSLSCMYARTVAVLTRPRVSCPSVRSGVPAAAAAGGLAGRVPRPGARGLAHRGPRATGLCHDARWQVGWGTLLVELGSVRSVIALAAWRGKIWARPEQSGLCGTRSDCSMDAAAHLACFCGVPVPQRRPAAGRATTARQPFSVPASSMSPRRVQQGSGPPRRAHESLSCFVWRCVP